MGVFSAITLAVAVGSHRANERRVEAVVRQEAPSRGVSSEDGSRTAREGRLAAIIRKNSKKLSLGQARELARLILDECEKYGLDPFLVLAVIKAESSFSVSAVSEKGAIGLMQVKPSTAREIAGELGLEFAGHESLHDPFLNVRLGIHYLGSLRARYRSIERALVAYNAGPARARVRAANLDENPPVYLRRVMAYRYELIEAASEI